MDIEYYCRHLENNLYVVSSPEYGFLVTPNGNALKPYHRWFHMKEGFSSNLLQNVLLDSGLVERDRLSILDCFAGVGTTILSALELSINCNNAKVIAHGIERNPFLEFVASTKINAIQDNYDTLLPYVDRIISCADEVSINRKQVPSLSTFRNEKYFDPQVLEDLLRIRKSIEITEGKPYHKNLALLCLAAIIEAASSLRKDGRALRFVPSKKIISVFNEFYFKAEMVNHDIQNSPKSLGHGKIFSGDGRNPQSIIPRENKYDLILFSPPYINNIDYTEIYKLEAWLLRYYNNAEEFRRQRLNTFRSHPSIKFPSTYFYSKNGYHDEFLGLLKPIIDSVPEDKDADWRRRLILGYFDDILLTLENCMQLLKEDGYMVIIVGNSLHGIHDKRFLIPADLMISKIAQIVGYRVDTVKIARQLARRRTDSQYCRESAIFLGIDRS